MASSSGSSSSSLRSPSEMSSRSVSPFPSIHDDEPISQSRKEKAVRCHPQFGIRSYLHKFYDYDSDRQKLLQGTRKFKICSPTLWKIIVWIGVTLVICGAVIFLIGRFVPRKPVIDNPPGNETYALFNQEALRTNRILDRMPLLGFILFAFSSALLFFNAFLLSKYKRYCYRDGDDITDVDVVKYSSLPTEEAKIPMLNPIPKTERIEAVQPPYKPGQLYQPIE